MRNWQEEKDKRIKYIQNKLKEAHADGIIYGNSGGKDSALVGILCKLATDNVLGVIMPCMSTVNYGSDTVDAIEVAEKFNIEYTTVDLTATKQTIMDELNKHHSLSHMAQANISPRLRMITLYALGQSKNYLVAGTDNACETYMGYFTKWGDGAYDFNPVADLTVAEVYQFLTYLDAPKSIISKAPSAGLFEGQTDEKEMGVKYAQIDEFLTTGATDKQAQEIIERYHARTEHKRKMPDVYHE